MTGQAVVAGLIALAAIASATVAVALGKIDGASYAAIVSGVTGVGLGAGVHSLAAGTTSAGGAGNPSGGP